MIRAQNIHLLVRGQEIDGGEIPREFRIALLVTTDPDSGGGGGGGVWVCVRDSH